MGNRRELLYYPSVLGRRLQHYVEKRMRGYTNRGSLEIAANEILTARAEQGFRAGSHFPGIWPRDLCFAARGLTRIGFAPKLREAADFMIRQIEDTFYTDFHCKFNAATPAEGVDTLPALVVLLDEAGGLRGHTKDISPLAALHREKFFDEETSLVTGAGSSWWDSAARSREAYNTAMLLTAIERLEAGDVTTTYTGLSEDVRRGFMDNLWNGYFFDEFRGSSVRACDANVVPLYFGLVDDNTAENVISSLAGLVTETGLKMRERPFTLAEVHPAFLFHPDYHYHVWPWNSFMYANGLEQYGYGDLAEREIERIEDRLRHYGNFLEVLHLNGDAYVKWRYASAEDFTVAAALWVEYKRRRSGSYRDTVQQRVVPIGCYHGGRTPIREAGCDAPHVPATRRERGFNGLTGLPDSSGPSIMEAQTHSVCTESRVSISCVRRIRAGDKGACQRSN